MWSGFFLRAVIPALDAGILLTKDCRIKSGNDIKRGLHKFHPFRIKEAHVGYL